MRKQRKRNADPLKQIEGRPTYLANLGPKPTEEEPRPNMQSPCGRRSRGGATWVRPHLQLPLAAMCHLLVPPPRRLHANLPRIFLQTDHSTPINRWGCLLLISSTQERNNVTRRRATLLFLVFSYF